jgi:hypothetical protein
MVARQCEILMNNTKSTISSAHRCIYILLDPRKKIPIIRGIILDIFFNLPATVTAFPGLLHEYKGEKQK